MAQQPRENDQNVLADWPELERVLKEERFEVVLKGVPSHERNPPLDDERVQNALFQTGSRFNLIELNACHLSTIHGSLTNCTNVTNLVLRGNLLDRLPDSIGDSLSHLRHVDLSQNRLEKLPTSMRNLEQLLSCNLAGNQLTDDGLFNFSRLVFLHVLELSANKLTRLPEELPKLPKLLEVHAQTNALTKLWPEATQVGDDETVFASLKVLRVEGNQLKDLPLELARCERLKTLQLGENPFDDRRFRKLANDKRASVAAQLDYLARKVPAQGKKKIAPAAAAVLKQQEEEEKEEDRDSGTAQ